MNQHRPIRVILKDQAKEEYESLQKLVNEQRTKGRTNSEEMQLLKSINQKKDILQLNPVYGQNIPKDLVPKNMAVDNLFRVELTHYWRMLYTLRTNEIEIVNFILYIVDHPTYDKVLGYRKR